MIMGKLNEHSMDELFAGITGMPIQPVASEPAHSEPSLQEPPKQENESAPLSSEQGKTKAVRKKVKPSVRKPQHSRKVSFLSRISESNLEKLRSLSNISGINVSDLIDHAVTRMLQSYERKHGAIPETKKKSIAELL